MEDMEDPAFLEDMGSTENLDTSADIEDAGETYGGGVVSCGEIREGTLEDDVDEENERDIVGELRGSKDNIIGIN